MEALFPLHYLPCIAWFQQAAKYSAIHIECSEHFVKQSYRSRCRILAANGVQVLSIPVVQPSKQKTILSATAMDMEFSWPHQHWQSLVSAYGKSAFFLYYRDGFEAIYRNPGNSLHAFNLALIKQLLSCFKLPIQLYQTSEYQAEWPGISDYRNSFQAKNPNPENELLKPIRYWQVFEDKYGYVGNLSAIDLLFNLGPEAEEQLRS
ncbi:MAG: WbqC family protein [Bacteroidia bacterium]|nr:WbqC family protein [Bacteroidia bacterium]